MTGEKFDCGKWECPASESGAKRCMCLSVVRVVANRRTQYTPLRHPNLVRKDAVVNRRTQYMPYAHAIRIRRANLAQSLHTVYALRPYARAIMRARLARVLIHVIMMSLLHLPEMAPTQIQYSEPHTEPPHHDGNGVP